MPPLAPEGTPDLPPAVATSRYRLSCAPDRPHVYLEDERGNRLAELFVLSSVHSSAGRDDAVAVSNWRLVEHGDHRSLECDSLSSVWESKTYRFRCWEERFSYEVEVQGSGSVTGLDLLGGYSSARLRWGSGFFWSSGSFGQIFNPEPTREERYHLVPAESTVIDTTGVPLAGRDGWFFTPPPFCFGLRHGRGWLALGVEARSGQNLFNEFHYRGHRDGFHLAIPYENPVAVDGSWRSPALGFDFAADEYEALAAHVASLRSQRLVAVPESANAPGWWRSPIFCGWGAQCHLAKTHGGRAPDYARQEHYEEFLASLTARGLSPGTVVLDDKWQTSYGDNRVDGEKWPDLPGFVAGQHAAGRKVLLWLKAWDPEGVPVEECIRNRAGEPVAVDPTNPAFERRFRRTIRELLSTEGADADGFKLDFSARIPASPGLMMHDRGVWGLELMRRYLWIIHDEAKSAKSDALIMTHTPHPYLADLVDMIRLNDINIEHDVARTMRHRARVAAVACPEAIIDTDNWPVPNREAWRSYLVLQPELGVPSLYFATHVDSTGETLEDADFELVRQAWELARGPRDRGAGAEERVM